MKGISEKARITFDDDDSDSCQVTLPRALKHTNAHRALKSCLKYFFKI